MFSTAQLEYIKAYLPTYAKQGYKFYLCYSDSDSSGGYGSQTQPDLYIIFSKSEITQNSLYSYSVGENSVLLSIRTGNYSTYNSQPRVTVADETRTTVQINSYEHVFTNAAAQSETVSFQPDFYLSSGGDTNVKLEAVSFILLVTLICSLLSRVFFKR